MSDLVITPAEVFALPDGTVIESTPECLWPQRYAGRRWSKRGDTLFALDRDPLTGTQESALIGFFKDPLPAKVV